MTYEQLIERGRQYLEAEGKSLQQVRNLLSALRLWIETHGLSLRRVVAEEFGAEFDRWFRRFCDAIAERGLARRTQRDRQEQVLRWHRIVEILRRRDSLPPSFADALRHCLATSARPRAAIARDCGISTNTLLLWTKGERMPRTESVEVISKLEVALELEPETLIRRLPPTLRRRYERASSRPDHSTAFTRLRRRQLAIARHYAIPFTPRLANQWRDLLRLKTDPLRPQARARNTWRLKPIAKVALRVSPAMVFDGRICVTAGVHWGAFSSYLGWLRLAPPIGPGIAADSADTLAWLADAERVIAYGRWLIQRSDNRYHNGVAVFLQLVESYLRPSTGFVWLRHDLRETVPHLKLAASDADAAALSEESAWRAHCEHARKLIRDFRVRAQDTMGIRTSRDPTERVAVVLNADFPLKKLVQFVDALEHSAPPPAHERDYRAWLRDVVLCKMLISNPLRIGQYAAMTYREDGTGNLRRVGPGRFRLRFDPDAFKNEKGAAGTTYDVEVDDSVAPWIDRYLAEARPYLLDADLTDRFFLPAVRGARKVNAALEREGLSETPGYKGEGLSLRIKTLTRKYIDGCPGFGPHAFRHVIATDHLRRHPGDYLTVATLLHDKLETVLRNYAHLRVNDGLRVLRAGIRQASEELAAMRNASHDAPHSARSSAGPDQGSSSPRPDV
jgi:transcriptional regulator with XRE-family HTH domain